MNKKNNENKIEKFINHAKSCCCDDFKSDMYTSPNTCGLELNSKGNIIKDKEYIKLEQEAFEYIVTKGKLHHIISENNIKRIFTEIVLDVYRDESKFNNAIKEIYEKINMQIKDRIYVLPNYHILLDGFETLKIGDVTISENNIKKGDPKNIKTN